MKSPVHRCRDVEHGRGQGGSMSLASSLQAEHRIPISKDVITSSSASAMWFIRDACGIVCAIITWLLVLYAEFVVVFVMLLPSKNLTYSIVNGTLFNLLAFLALASHLRAMCTDPGAVPKGNATKEYIESLHLKPGQVVYKCPKCCSIKPDRAHHCSVCKRCIRKMDHHCPWVNNCVGENNQKYFVLFTMYIALISLHALLMVVFHFLYCFEDDWTKCSSFSPPATVILLILLCFEGLLFLIFTSVMFGTQVHSICTDETLHIPLRLLCGGLLFACNAVMWTFFSKALRHSSSSARATVTTTASNFISSAILGKVIFGESHVALWWVGITLTLCGLLLLHGSTHQSLPQEEEGKKDK